MDKLEKSNTSSLVPLLYRLKSYLYSLEYPQISTDARTNIVNVNSPSIMKKNFDFKIKPNYVP